MSPPGNSSGVTTKLSVVKRSRASGTCTASNIRRGFSSLLGGLEDLVDQVAHSPPADAMGHGDMDVAECLARGVMGLEAATGLVRRAPAVSQSAARAPS